VEALVSITSPWYFLVMARAILQVRLERESSTTVSMHSPAGRLAELVVGALKFVAIVS